MKLAPSILSADFANLEDSIRQVIDANGVDYLHIDVMDGHFVPSITLGAPVVKSLRRAFADLPFDTHLMIENPEKYIDEFCDAGSDIVTVHAEATPHINRAVNMIKEKGKKAGVALNPGTDLGYLTWIIKDIDLLLIMSVNPGFGGQKFIPSSIEKIKCAKEMIQKAGSHALLEVDGGVTTDNIYEITKAGADIVVAGTAVFKAPDIKNAVRLFYQNAYQA